MDSAPDAALGFRRETGCALRFEVPGYRAGARGPQRGFLQTSGMKCYRDPDEGSGSCVFVKDDFNGEESRCVSPAEALAWQRLGLRGHVGCPARRVRGALLEAGTYQSPRPGLRLRLSQGAKPALFAKEETEAQRAMISTLSSHAPRRTRKMGDLREAVAEGGRGAVPSSAPCPAPGRRRASLLFYPSLCFDFDFHVARLSCFEQAVPELGVGSPQTAEPGAAEQEGRTVSLRGPTGEAGVGAAVCSRPRTKEGGLTPTPQGGPPSQP